jgi:hypothetical protein
MLVRLVRLLERPIVVVRIKDANLRGDAGIFQRGRKEF